MRLRRLRSGTLALVRLRRPWADLWPRTGLADRDCGIEGCDLRGGPLHRHLDLPEAKTPAPPELRPVPAANAWPDDAVLLTYAELRALVSLHLDLCRETMPGVAPWDWIKDRARAMRDGETPLLLSEVMEP